jgi:hypothetical protein
MNRPGRTCPADYRYPATVFRREPELWADTLYIAGGLYGNPFAAATLLELAACEHGSVRVIFNGDFHWFDHTTTLFTAIDDLVAAHVSLRGNVETELVREPSGDPGCGCSYPALVADEVVERSNRIMDRQRPHHASALTRPPRPGYPPLLDITPPQIHIIAG